MKQLFIFLWIFIAFQATAQNKTAAHFWGRVPPAPAADRTSFSKFIEECENLGREISEEADIQNAMVEKKAQNVNPSAIQVPTNMDPAAIQKMMKRTQDRVDFMNELTAKGEAFTKWLDSITADFEKAYDTKVKALEEKVRKLCPDGAMSVSDEARVPACDAALKELDKAKAELLNRFFLGNQSPFPTYLSAYATWLKKTEPEIIRMRDESFEGTGISVKGMPCADVLKNIGAYLAQVKLVYEKALFNNLVN